MKFRLFKIKLDFNNYQEMYVLFRSRAFQLAFIMLLIVFALIYRLYDLQVLNHMALQKQSEKNRFSFVPIIPYRGRLFDRNGVVLADNEARFTLQVNTKIKRVKIQELIAEVSDKLDLDKQLAWRLYEKNKRHSRQQQSVSFAVLNDTQAAHFSNISFLYPDITLDYQIVRIYPQKQLAVHVLGYVGLVDEAALNDVNLFSEENDRFFTHVGKNGIERYYERELRGQVGHKIIEVNVNGKKIKDIEIQPSTNGTDLQLTIDARLQKHADDQLQGQKGAAILMDASNGEILLMSSAPNYDNNIFTSAKELVSVFNNQDKPLLNRSIKALYPPASTIKPFIALAGLHYNFLQANKRFLATPYFKIEGLNRRFHDWKKQGHGWVNLNEAMAKSSDVYFYDLGHRMGINKLSTFLSQFIFGQKTGIDIHGELRGILPSPEWKYAENRGRWTAGETVITAIGQGYFLITPLQLALATTILANHGEIVRPSLVRFNPKNNKDYDSHRIQWYDQKDWDSVRSSLYDAVNKPYGTAYAKMKGSLYSVAGKTGTAQLVNLVQNPDEREKQKKSLKGKFRDHSLFVGFAPYNNPEVTVVVVVENGGNGSGIATAISRSILDKYFQIKTATLKN